MEVSVLIHATGDRLCVGVCDTDTVGCLKSRIVSDLAAAAGGAGAPPSLVAVELADTGEALLDDLQPVCSTGMDAMSELVVRLGASVESPAEYEVAEAIVSVCVSPSSRRCALGGSFGLLSMWATETGTQVWEAQGTSAVLAVAVSACDTWAACSWQMEHTVGIFMADTGEQRHLLRHHDDWVRDICFTPCGTRLVSCSDDTTVRVSCVESGACLRQLPNTGHSILTVVSTDSTVVCGGCVSTLTVWELQDDATRRLTGHTQWVYDLAMAPCGTWFVSASFDSTLRVWSLETMECTRVLRGHRDAVERVSLSSTRLVYSMDISGGLRWWDLCTEEGGPVSHVHTHICNMALTSCAKWLFCVCDTRVSVSKAPEEGRM